MKTLENVDVISVKKAQANQNDRQEHKIPTKCP